MNTIISISAFVILTLLWLGFGAAIFFKRELLDNGWKTFRQLPILVQLAVTLLVLPVVVGLWIWHNRWPFWLRLILVAGLGWMTIYTFFPHIPLA